MLDRVLNRYERGFGEFNERWVEVHALLGAFLAGLDDDNAGELGEPHRFPAPPREEQPVRSPEGAGDREVARVERVDVASVLSGSSPLVDTGWPDVSVGGEFEGFDPQGIGAVIDP